jgi:hypothetical protein
VTTFKVGFQAKELETVHRSQAKQMASAVIARVTPMAVVPRAKSFMRGEQRRRRRRGQRQPTTDDEERKAEINKTDKSGNLKRAPLFTAVLIKREEGDDGMLPYASGRRLSASGCCHWNRWVVLRKIS